MERKTRRNSAKVGSQRPNPALRPMSGVFWWGFALPIPPIFALIWTILILANWQVRRTALAALGGPATPKQVTAVFKGARGARMTELLETVASLRQAREVEGERFMAQ